MRALPSAERLMDRSLPEIAFAQFSVLWAIAALFHVASVNEWRTSWPPILGAAWVLVQPGRALPLAALAAGQIWITVVQAPFIANHVLLTALINGAVLLGIGVVYRRHGSATPAAVYEMWAPAARVALVAMYVFAVFHKLNADFFDPDVSCGATFYVEQLTRFPFLPASKAAVSATIYLTVLVEAAIPVLLLLRRTRHLGVLVGAVFHWLLALHPKDGFYNFSSMLLAVFYLYASDVIAARTADVSKRWLTRLSRGALAVIAVGAIVQQSGVGARLGAPEPFLYLWAVYGSVLIAGYLVIMQGTWRAPAHARSALRLEPVMAVLPFVVVLNGFSPYLGLKTETSWAMFSNLRTEGGQSNHWFVPVHIQVFDYQRDLIELVEASDRGLQNVADRGFLIPFFELRRKPWMAIAYRENGEIRRYSTVADDPRYPGDIPWVLKKLLSFRPVTSSLPQPCVH
jgi:hypothetical protein